jgi:hypothetical protein
MEDDYIESKNLEDKNIYKIENEIPPSSVSKSSYGDLYKTCTEYHSELKKLNLNKESKLSLSMEDFIVLNDLVIETNSYSSYLILNGYYLEGAKLIQLNLKNINFMIKFTRISFNTGFNEEKINKNKIDILLYPFSLKLTALELKFYLFFNVQKNYDEAEKLLNEIIKIQNVLQMPKFNTGSSTFFMAIVKFCKIKFHNIN